MTLDERRKQVKQARDELSPMRGYANRSAGKPKDKPHSRPDRDAAKSGPAARESVTTLAAATTDPAWVTAYATAYPAYLSIGGQLKFSSGTASSYSGLWLYVMDEAGKFVYDQEISKTTDDPTGKFLENGAWCYGWWAGNSYPTDQCFWWSSNQLSGHLQDGKKYYAWIFLKGSDGTWSSNGTTSPLVEAFYTPGIPGAQAGICTCYAQAHRADPVNTATGMFFERLTDAQMVGVGKQVSLERTYRSDSTTTGLLGRGWATPYDSKLTITGSTVTYQADDGAKFVFTQASDGTYTAPAGSAAKLVKGSSTYTLTTLDYTKRTFSSTGQLTSVVDKAGQGLTLTYTSGKLSSVKDAAGRTTGFTLNADGLVTKVDLPDSTSVSYGYGGGLLTSVTDPAGRTSSYAYNTDKRLSSYTDPAGGKVSNTYDTNGRIKSQTDQNNKTTNFTWDGSRESHTTAPDGGVWTDVYSGNVLLESIDPYGKTVSYDYDGHLRPVDITDQRGNTTSMTYDSAGHMLSRSSPSSLGYSESWTYGAAGNILSHTDGRTYKTSYGYNTANQLVSSTDPLGGKTAYTYTAQGALQTVTTPRGNKTTYGYDAAGNRTSVTTPLGEKTTFTYDAAGRMLSMTGPRGNVSGADPAAYTTKYAYDGRGVLKSATDPLGRTTGYEYNGAEQLTSIENPAGSVTRYEYDDAGNLTKTTDAAGESVTRTFDVHRNVTSETDPLGNKTIWNYDKLGRLISAVSARGNVSGANPVAYTTSYAYDAAGNRTKVTDPTGASVTTEYDAVNRPVKVTDALNKSTLYGYDANDNVTKVTDPLTKTVSSVYDKNNRLSSTTDQLGRTTTYAYDADGNLLSTTSPLGNKESRTYDADGRLSSSTDPRGNAPGATPDEYTTWYEYTADGYQKAVIDAYGATTYTDYDVNGNTTRVNDRDGRVTTYRYDDLDRLTKVNAPDGGTTSYTYDAVGNVKERTDANNHTTTYGYDAAHRPESVTDPLGRVTSYAYDADGNPTRTTTPRGTTTHNYDARNLLTKTDYSDSTPDVSYGYDAVGRLTSRANSSLAEDFTYDAVGNLKETRGFSYTYDAAGRLLTRTLADGNTVSYTYDADGRTATMAADSTSTEYAYDAAGNLTLTTLPNTETESRTYDRDGRLTAVTSAKAGATVTSTSRGLSAGGLPISVYVSRAGVGGGGWDLTYDGVGRLTSSCAPQPTDVGCPASRATTYTYDKVGNRLTSTLGTTTTSYSYDAADQLTSTTGSTTTAYAYDGEGNQTKAGADTYAYDLAGQITAATVAGTGYTYTHDATGNQLTAGKAGTVLNRTEWDPNAPLPMLATEYDSAGAVKQSYRYDPLGQPAATKTGAGTVFYYHHDTQGSPVDVTGSTGTLYERWTYDPYGTRSLNTVAGGAPAGTPSFTGARYETTTGNLDLHARQYNTATGRFNRPDPATRDQSTPYVSAYAYADNAPTLYTDPSGLTPVPGDNGNGKVDNLGEGLKIFGDGFLQGLKAPFEFLGDAHDAVTGQNGGAGAFLDKYLPVRPAYRLYRAEYMLRQQGCDALADLYADAADELAQQLAVTGVGGLTGWRRAADATDVRGHKIPTYGRGVGPAAERIHGGRTDGQTVIAGHGWYVRGTGDMQMPSGTWGYFYIEDGVGLRQTVGLAVEKGEKIKPTEIVGPGKSLPNYTVAPGDNLRMMSGSITVSRDTLLSEILKPNMGPVHLAICRKHCDPRR
ncbi:putative adhesin [Streptomyces shenzhenensis]|uniref:putative adhesin n=1 Tax=Streptomyces shenzhenensis TaxID=943815 RepID=UPI00382F85FE